MGTPTYLVESYFNGNTQAIRQSTGPYDFARDGEMLVDVYFQEEVFAENGSLSVDAQGAVTGDESGSLRVTKDKRAVLTLPDSLIPFLLSPAGDVLVRAISEDPHDQEFVVAIKKPTDATTAGLAGNWRVLEFVMPDDITEVYYNSQTMQTRNTTSSSDFGMEGEQLVDLFFKGEFETVSAPVTIAGNGTFSGAFGGTISTTIDGTVTINAGEGNETFFLNHSKDLIIRTLKELDDVRITIIVKLPSATTLADVAGPWRLTSMSTATRLREAYYNGMTQMTRTTDDSGEFAMTGEQLVDTFFSADFEIGGGVLSIKEDGTMGGIAAGGTVAITGPGTGTVTLGPDVYTFYANPTHDVMWSVSSNSEEQEIFALVRIPVEPMKLVLDPEDTNPTLFWEGQSGVKLQKSTDLGAGWSDVSNSTGDSSYTGSRVTAEFFRLVTDPGN